MTISDIQRRIELIGVTKVFRRNPPGARLLRQLASRRKQSAGVEFLFAVRNVSFQINDGESVAIVGSNGAGKSTVLNLITGVVPPDQGVLRVKGRIASLLELGAGFHSDLTGRENLELNAALIGLRQRESVALYSEIVDFAGISDFMDQPIRTYSTGMVMRLAFSVAIHSDPDILVIDEVLGVGDQTFQAKCSQRLFELRERGKTIICVSHSADALLKLCQRALWLNHGELVMDDTVERVLSAYSGRLTREPLPA